LLGALYYLDGVSSNVDEISNLPRSSFEGGEALYISSPHFDYQIPNSFIIINQVKYLRKVHPNPDLI
jgi:hypothetical protein